MIGVLVFVYFFYEKPHQEVELIIKNINIMTIDNITKESIISNVYVSVNGMFHNLAAYGTRGKVHEYYRQLEESGFAMVDPKPALNKVKGNGNYFFFVHPISTYGVLWEFVSLFYRDEQGKACYDWADTDIYMVPPSVKS